MSLRAPTTNQNRTPQENLEPGTYPARIVRVLDLGLHPQQQFPGDPKQKPPAYMINVTYELVDVFMQDEDGEDIEDKPRWISEEFPLHSLSSDLARSTKRYKAIDPDGKYEGDWAQLLGSPCMVTTAQSVSKKNGQTYDNVSNVTQARARDAAKMPELKNPALFLDLGNPDLEIFGKLPKWQQDKIKSNLEFAGSPLERLLAGETKAPPKKAGKPALEPVEVEDEAEDAPW